MLLLYSLRKNFLMLGGFLILIVLLIIASCAPLIAPYDPLKVVLPEKLHPPSRKHLFGTDTLGRDILSRVIFGARTSILIGVIVIVAGCVLGLTLGILSGYLRGLVETVIMRVVDMFLSIPFLLLAIAVSAVLKGGQVGTAIALVVPLWPVYARIARSQVLSVRSQEYIQAARATGAGTVRIMGIHILPNVISPVLVQATIDFGNVILWFASLSFIGLGAQPPTPEWGAMISHGRNLLRDAWWYPTFPGLAIFLSVMGLNLVGDALRDILDPQLR